MIFKLNFISFNYRMLRQCLFYYIFFIQFSQLDDGDWMILNFFV